jgi:acyl-CoA synthetase (AMP-forming)/AMP-acid ligase II
LTLPSILRHRAVDTPARVVLTFLRDGENDERQLTYGELDRLAAAAAQQFQSRAQRGDRVLLLQPTGPEFFAAFFGCLYAGLIPIPLPAPRPRQSLQPLREIARDSGATLAVATPDLCHRLQPRLAQAVEVPPVIALIEGERLGEDGVDALPSIDPDRLAYLQYTSGSTGNPKGVMVTHASLLHNLRMIEAAGQQSSTTIFVSWLPLFHDLGLVAVGLQAIYLGAHAVLLPPLHVLQKPWRWLRAVTRYRATTSGAPNFAYDLCLKTPDDVRDQLDLSCWHYAFSAAEPVRADTLARFVAAFGPRGFRSDAFYPSYGLAEATVFVTARDHARPLTARRFSTASLREGVVVPLPSTATEGTDLVGCGRPWLGQDVAIVDAVTRRRCAVDHIGEIWVSGRGVARGYWNRPAETSETFEARLVGEEAGGFLRTGDLGFLYDGELFVTGRLKDLIIVRGSNYYPQDIEAIVERAHDALAANAGAAFALDLQGEERIIIVHELRRPPATGWDITRIVADIRQAVTAEHALHAHAVVLVAPGGVPRTTSGKVRRSACRERLLAGTLDVLGADYGDPDCRGSR